MKQGMVLFLRDRFGWSCLYFGGFFFIMIYFLLTFRFHHISLSIGEWFYFWVLVFTPYIVHIIFSFLRWYPIYQEWNFRSQQISIDHFVKRKVKGSMEQKFYQQVLLRQSELFLTEQEKLAERYRLQQDFMNLWVHQMKTPLAAISLDFQQAPTHPDQLKSWIVSLEEEWEKLDRGLDLALSMARIEDFTFDYHIQPISLIDDVRQLLNDRRKSFIRHRIYPQLDAEKSLNWTILSDKKWNRFLLDQIIQNAIKYTAQVRQQSQLLILLTQEGKEIVCSIRDQGPGIPAQDLKRVYAPFFTGENGRLFAEATGMGLYLVKRLCDELGHQIHMESEFGKGTTVILRYQKYREALQ
ncbi:Signal transduction histidine kinase [Seinonella peptonophila]|uniref:histidine kinase n=2 Tax=Seinonella peptonophila TaxID=112248 RepID=A0A1M4SQN4_9BACL|nr:Signal transduction histidine kinase [Seinonella peptonophila]